MNFADKAKILLTYGSFDRYLKVRLGSSIYTSAYIEDQIIDSIQFLVDATDIAEELKSHESKDISEEDIENCMFESWNEAFIFYQERVIRDVAETILKEINIYDEDMIETMSAIIEIKTENLEI